MKLRQKAVIVWSFAACTATLAACGGSSDNSTPPAHATGPFKPTVLVSDGSVTAPNTDANLKNG